MHEWNHHENQKDAEDSRQTNKDKRVVHGGGFLLSRGKKRITDSCNKGEYEQIGVFHADIPSSINVVRYYSIGR